MDKKIVVNYINVAGVPVEETLDMLEEVSSRLESIDPDIVNYIVPICEGETRVECINPDLLTGEMYIEAVESVEKIKEILEDLKKNVQA